MANFKNKYDWNNPKEINNNELFNEFIKCSIQNKIIVYRLLITSRRKMLRIEWNKIKEAKKTQMFLGDAKYIMKPLLEWLSIGSTIKDSDIKDDYELLLVYQMIHDIKFEPTKTIDAIDVKAEESSFEKARKKMIDFINIFNERRLGYESVVFEDSLKIQLETLKYEPPNTKQNMRLTKRDIYLTMMYTIGMGKERALIIIKALEKFKIHRDSLTNECKNQFDKKLLEWDNLIDFDFKTKAQRYFYNVFNNINQHP